MQADQSRAGQGGGAVQVADAEAAERRDGSADRATTPSTIAIVKSTRATAPVPRPRARVRGAHVATAFRARARPRGPGDAGRPDRDRALRSQSSPTTCELTGLSSRPPPNRLSVAHGAHPPGGGVPAVRRRHPSGSSARPGRATPSLHRAPTPKAPGRGPGPHRSGRRSHDDWSNRPRSSGATCRYGRACSSGSRPAYVSAGGDLRRRAALFGQPPTNVTSPCAETNRAETRASSNQATARSPATMAAVAAALASAHVVAATLTVRQGGRCRETGAWVDDVVQGAVLPAATGDRWRRGLPPLR